MRYNFSLAPKIKGYIEWQLSHYHEDKRQLEETRNSMIPSGTANYSPMGGHGGPGDPTANTVEKMLIITHFGGGYMSKPNHRWYGNVIRAIRYYPDLETSEQLSPREAEELSAVHSAIEDIGRQQDGGDVLKIIELVDWRKTHTLEGTAMKLHMSNRTARRRRERFIKAVAKNMRYF